MLTTQDTMFLKELEALMEKYGIVELKSYYDCSQTFLKEDGSTMNRFYEDDWWSYKREV